MRIAVGGVWHETNTFAPAKTTLADFEAYHYARGESLLKRHRGSGTELGGAIDALESQGADVIPLTYAAAVPSGPVEASAFEALASRIVADLAEADDLDGIVLSLHGAMVVEGRDDPEAELVDQVKSTSRGLPVAITLDLHANVSPRLAARVDALTIYRTFPHVDMAARGAEAAAMLTRILEEGASPAAQVVKLPLLTAPQVQDTGEGPMRSAVEAIERLAEHPDVWSASFAPGYPYSDVERLGFALCAVSEVDVGHLLERAAERVWADREQMLPQLVSVDVAVERAREGPWPIVLADVADNVGGGSPGDGTVILTALREAGIDGCLAVVWDPKVVADLYSSREASATVAVGGHSAEFMGPPVTISGRVERPGEVTYRRTGDYMRGSEVSLGRIAIVRDDLSCVVVTERRVMPFDRDHLEVLGLDPATARSLIVKGATAWREPFGPLAAQALYVDTPGFCPGDLARLEYTRCPRPIWPLDEFTEFSH